jgi:hypothetical protein
MSPNTRQRQLSKLSALLVVFAGLLIFSGHLVVSGQTLPKFSTTEAQVRMSVSIGEPVLKLWGYGPPNSRIEINGEKVTDFTYSETNGYFEFLKTYLPTPDGLYYPELCLTGIDQIGRATPPTCIPALLANEFSYDIGPVILPPTLSLDTAPIDTSSQAGAEGITIPNSDVKIVLAEDGGNQNLADFSLIKEAKAYYIPDYTVKSDPQGYFSFNMPSTNPNKWRVFAITTYSQGATSPKSNTLVLNVISPFATWLENIWRLILSLLTLPALIVLEVVAILLILAVLFFRKNKKQLSPSTSAPIKQYQEYLKTNSPS